MTPNRVMALHDKLMVVKKRLATQNRWGLCGLFVTAELALVATLCRSGFFVPILVEKGSLWWTQFPWSAAAGLIALATFLLNRAQQQQHFDRKELAEQFKDILDRFADNDNPIMRINAAIRLSEKAGSRLPGKRVERDPENYPFFASAAAQLSAALHMETEPPVRAEILKALRRMVEFARVGDQRFLRLLIGELVDANRTARTEFENHLARYCSLNGSEVGFSELRPLVGFTPFCNDTPWPEASTLYCLIDMVKSPTCQSAITVCGQLGMARGEGELGTQERGRILEDMRSSASKLMHTRTALATALRSLIAGEQNYTLMLEGCFLAGADLSGAQLRGARLRGTLLQGANLHHADLQEAELSHLQCARLDQAQLQCACLDQAHLQNASLWQAQLQGAYLGWANLHGAYVRDAALGEAMICGVQIWNANELFPHTATFTGSNWWDADFSFPLPDAPTNDSLIPWLSKHFPKPVEERPVLPDTESRSSVRALSTSIHEQTDGLPQVVHQ
jgi:hypothetical protein